MPLDEVWWGYTRDPSPMPAPSTKAWVPSFLAFAPGTPPSWAMCREGRKIRPAVVESGSPSLCGPRPFSHTLGAKTFKCIGESPGLTMTKNASQEYSIPSLWVERQRHSKGHLGISVQITRSPFIFNPAHSPHPESSRNLGHVWCSCVHFWGPHIV